MSKQRYYLCVAGILGAWAVVMGAFGAHAVRTGLGAEMADAYETAVDYHFFHALAVLGVAAGMDRVLAGPGWVWACRMWTAGIVLFSGSLYALAVTGGEWLGLVTPFGGAAMIAGWISVIVAAARGAHGGADE